MSTRAEIKTSNNNIKHKKILTNREIEFLCLLALGYKNNVIAKNLFVAKSTVKKTLENIFKKINAKDRANAVAIGFIHNLINPELLTKIEEECNLVKNKK